MMKSTSSSEFTLTGRHVLAGLLGFFGVVFSVNAWFMTSAISTYSGVVSNEPYRKGLAYNERIAAGERQAELHWETTLDAQRSGEIAFAATGPDGRPITQLVITGTIGRPATQVSDQRMTFREQTPGRYSASVAPLDDGTWLIALEARRDSANNPILYRMRKRLWLKH
jgi:nitrogen fixation protein FixH